MVKKQFDAINYELLGRQQKTIAQGALTNSKRPSCFVDGIYPTHLERGNGSLVWDPKGNQYIDYICGLGTNILGYGNAEIEPVVLRAYRDGASLSLSTETEIVCAEKIKELFPFVDRLKFLKTGSEATSAALRIARAFTKKKLILSSGYHSWHDHFVSLTEPRIGVVDQLHIREFHDAHIFAYDFTDVAAVIVEPVVTDASPERVEFLHKLREYCTQNGTLLIFDEIITGFRFPRYSVSGHFGITPDIICLGKAIANGLPLSVVAGKKHIMECDEYFVSSTFAGERMSLAAATRTMELLQKKFSLTHLWEEGGKFLRLFNALWPEKITIKAYPTRGTFEGDEQVRALFFQEAVKAGMLFGRSWFFNFGHIEYTDQVIHSCNDIIQKIKMGSVELQGQMPKTPFAQQQREKKT